MAETTAQSHPAKRSRTKTFLVIAGVFAVILVCVLAAVTAPDQLRPIATPAPLFLPAGEDGATDSNMDAEAGAADIEGESSTPAVSRAAETGDSAVALPRIGPPSRAEILRATCPIPDLDAVPEDLRHQARALNDEVSSLTISLLDIVDASKELSWEEARERLSAAWKREEGIQAKYSTPFPKEWLLWELSMLGGQVHYQIMVDHGKWLEGAFQCQRMEFCCDTHDPGRTEWRERKVYCYRRDGWRGRAMMAGYAVKDAARTLESILDPPTYPSTQRP